MGGIRGEWESEEGIIGIKSIVLIDTINQQLKGRSGRDYFSKVQNF
jgi:hypothetical protein